MLDRTAMPSLPWQTLARRAREGLAAPLRGRICESDGGSVAQSFRDNDISRAPRCADVAWPASCSVWWDDERPWRPQLDDAGATPDPSMAVRPLYEGAPDISVRDVRGRGGSPLRVALGRVRSPANEPRIGSGRVAIDRGPRCNHCPFGAHGGAGRGEHRLYRGLAAERERRVDSDEHRRPTCSTASQDRPPEPPPDVCTPRARRGGVESES